MTTIIAQSVVLVAMVAIIAIAAITTALIAVIIGWYHYKRKITDVHTTSANYQRLAREFQANTQWVSGNAPEVLQGGKGGDHAH